MSSNSDVTHFSGDYRFLSNFYPSRVVLGGVTFPSVEHAYQAAKAYPASVKSFKDCTAAEAKRKGKRVKLRPGWEGMKLNIMLDLLRQKFSKEPLRTMLLETGDSELIEGNTWRDTFWGVYKGKGQNHLGRLLMQIRKELISSQ